MFMNKQIIYMQLPLMLTLGPLSHRIQEVLFKFG